MNKIIFILFIIFLLSKFSKEILLAPANFRNNINCLNNDENRYLDKEFDDMCSNFDGENKFTEGK